VAGATDAGTQPSNMLLTVAESATCTSSDITGTNPVTVDT